ncbi:lantibiotic dehydratase [Fodinicola acaciae]|uniref:lantibiotic dehydratase n=1 Tax=Fodinicola acaciae TaxID=2681555 RepID=UPI0013D6DB54|nr:lantibiotic dehydratase [Fodinicola acaciae]
MVGDVFFQAADFALIRLTAAGRTARLPAPPADLDDAGAMAAFLAEVAADPVLREVVAVSSAALDTLLEKVAAGDRLTPKRLRRATTSVTRYLSRMAVRPTPFGLLAGVTAARFDAEPKTSFGSAHRRQVFPDGEWLDELVHRYERHPAVIGGLSLVRNDLAFARGDRLVVPYVRKDDASWGADGRERSVRHTRAVRVAVAAATAPIRHRDLVSALRKEFPDVTGEAVTGLLSGLVEQDVLLTDLRPDPATGDPLGHLLDRLGDHPDRATLARVRDLLRQYAETPYGGGTEALRRATTAMRKLSETDHPVQVDLRVDADIVLPRAVASELEQAVSTAATLATRSDHLAGYRAEFLDRYGSRTLVPVAELLDPQIGLGPPAGYAMPPGTREVPPAVPGERDDVLLELAQRAAAQRTREIVLTDEIVGRLATDDGRPRYLEACFQLLADSTDRLAAGDFLLVGSPNAHRNRPGALFGRFLSLEPGLAPAVGALAQAVAGEHQAVQVVAAPVHARNVNVVRVPQVVDMTIRTGVFADRGDPAVLALDDLLVGADRDRLFVVSGRDGREVVPLALNSLYPALTLTNAVRLLIEIGESRSPRYRLWDWGSASRLPYLPRVRVGRVILSSATWRPDHRLSDQRLDAAAWKDVLRQWRADWAVPAVVLACVGDRRVRLDLRRDTDLRILRAELRAPEGLVVQEEPAGGRPGTGWADGHAAEIVVPLLHRDPAPVRTPPLRHATRSVHLPGGEWLSLKLYAARDRQPEILVRLPELLARHTGQWFFLRYWDSAPHLRLRLHRGRLADVHDWAAGLVDTGLLGDLVVDTYRPEIMRYGGPAAIEAAERAFHADSVAALAQLALPTRDELPIELLAAANVIDLTRRLRGPGWREWLVRAYEKDPARHAAVRAHRQANLIDGDELLPGLAEIWSRRGPAIEAYGQAIGSLPARDARTAVSGLLHMHHNRLAGIDPETEQRAYAIARGVVQAHLDRAAHQR